MTVPDEVYESAARLTPDKDFQRLIKYLNESAQDIALGAMEINDVPEVYRSQGRVRMLSELYHMFSNSRTVVERKQANARKKL